ncbi:ABC transporter permease subunit [Paracoccus sp. P2]|uniref:ABC transporter permease subunit n=1 Tax=Paracoccus sp. P2 TaxID=3248840 RepID=UPI00391F5914
MMVAPNPRARRGVLDRLARNDRAITLLLLIVPLGMLALFFLYPLFGIIRRALTGAEGLGFENFVRVASLPHIPRVVLNSVTVGLATTLVCITLGFAIAFMLHRTRIPGKNLVRLALILPLLAPSLVQALGLIFMFGRNGLVNNWLGLDIQIYGFWGLLLANCMYALPQAVLIIETSLRRSDARIYEASLLMGASRWRRFIDITLPATKFGLISAAFVIFTVSITDFGNAAVIGGNFQVLAMEIYTQVVSQMDFNMGAVVGIMLLLPTLLAVYIQRIANQRQFGGSSESAIPVQPDRVLSRDIPLATVVYVTAGVVALIVATVVFASFVRLWPYRMELTLANYNISMAGGYSSLWSTLLISFQTALIGSVLLFMLALAQRELVGGTARLVYFLAIVPVGVPGLVLGLSYVLSFNVPGPVLGALYGSSFLIAICNFYHYHSQGFLTMVTGIRAVPQRLEETVLCLGGNNLHRLRDTILPFMAPTLVSVFFFLFMRAMVTLSAIIFLVSPQLSVAAVTVVRLDQAGRSTQAAAFSVCVMLSVLMAMLAMRLSMRLITRRAETAQ